MARIFDRLSDWHLSDTNALKNWGQRVVEQLEEALATIQTNVDDLAAVVADVAAAQSAADAAQTTANTAQSSVTTTARNDKISASYCAPISVLSASDAGSNATITIAAHTRVYGDGTTLAVSGGSITGRSYGTTYYIYYTDATTADTTPTYLSTTNANTAMNNRVNGRHFVGAITTPTAGGSSTSGDGPTPPGAKDGIDIGSTL